jgi:hypothetical protein
VTRSRDAQLAAEQLRRVFDSHRQPSTPRPARAAGGRRGRRADGGQILERMVDAAAARIAREITGPAVKGQRPDGRRVSLEEKEQIVRRFAPAGGWHADPGNMAASMITSTVTGDGRIRPPVGYATPFGW